MEQAKHADLANQMAPLAQQMFTGMAKEGPLACVLTGHPVVTPVLVS